MAGTACPIDTTATGISLATGFQVDFTLGPTKECRQLIIGVDDSEALPVSLSACLAVPSAFGFSHNLVIPLPCVIRLENAVQADVTGDACFNGTCKVTLQVTACSDTYPEVSGLPVVVLRKVV